MWNWLAHLHTYSTSNFFIKLFPLESHTLSLEATPAFLLLASALTDFVFTGTLNSIDFFSTQRWHQDSEADVAVRPPVVVAEAEVLLAVVEV